MERPAIGAADRVSRFDLLASAIARTTVSVVRVDPGEPSFTDGRLIHIQAGETSTGTATTVPDSLLVQAALLGAGSLAPDVLRSLVGRPAVTRRYLVLEAQRALRALQEQLGAVDVGTLLLDLPIVTTSPAESLRAAIGRSRLPAAPAEYGVIRPRRLLARGASHSTPAGARGASSEQQIVEVDEFAVGEDEETAGLGFLDKLFANAGLSISLKLLKKVGVGREKGDGPAGAEAASGVARRGTGRAAALVATELRPTAILDEVGGLARVTGWRYPEWDTRRRCYRPQWCTVVEMDPAEESGEPRARVDAVVLRRTIGRLALALARHRHQREGDDVDIDAAVTGWVDLAAGQPPDERFYLANRRTRRDLACLVLLDVSGSTADPAAEGSVHARQVAAATGLVEVFDRLGDRVALYGFRSCGRSDVSFVRVKAFDDALDQRAYGRLGRLVPQGFTRAGAGIRHATRMLRAQAGTERMLLVLISDGTLYDYGYEGPYAEEDVRRALEEARRGGVGAVCLTFGSSTAEGSQPTAFRSAVRAGGERIEDIAPDIARAFVAALASADRGRRAPTVEGSPPSPRRSVA